MNQSRREFLASALGAALVGPQLPKPSAMRIGTIPWADLDKLAFVKHRWSCFRDPRIAAPLKGVA